MSTAGVLRELLVRYLETWTPGALHAARRATFAQGWRVAADAAGAEAALRVFGEYGDRMRGRQLSVLLVAPDAAGLPRRLDAVPTPPEVGVYPVPGTGPDQLAVALSAARSAGSPLLVYLDTTPPPADPAATARAVRAVRAAGRPAELILLAPAGGWPETRATMADAGFPLTAGVELVEPAAGADAVLVGFATGLAKNLEAFKNALWAVDEYAGVRYRDPQDPAGHLLDIALEPHPGPLRRELLAHLATAGARTVTELRRFTLTGTVYRAGDTMRALSALLAAGAVRRTPGHGRLSGDVVIDVAVDAAGGPVPQRPGPDGR